MRTFYKLSLSVLLIGLAAMLTYVTRLNGELKRDLSDVIDSIAASKGSCVLPPMASETEGAKSISLAFPRERPLLVLAARRDCPYCKFALRAWSGLIKDFPQLDTFLYDPTKSYTLDELSQHGIPPDSVLITKASTAPYNELLSRTPTVMLVGRSGRALAVWTGELSKDRSLLIKSSVKHLMN